MGFSVSDGRGRFEYSGTPWGLFARPAHLLSPTFLGMLRDWRRFNREARALIGMNGTAPSLGHWLEQQGFSRHFVERLIVPQAAPSGRPTRSRCGAFRPASWPSSSRTTGCTASATGPDGGRSSGGSRSYVEAIIAPWRDRVRTAAPVRRIERLGDRVRIEAEGCESEEFDQVVIATHSDQALGDARRPERG